MPLGTGHLRVMFDDEPMEYRVRMQSLGDGGRGESAATETGVIDAPASANSTASAEAGGKISSGQALLGGASASPSSGKAVAAGGAPASAQMGGMVADGVRLKATTTSPQSTSKPSTTKTIAKANTTKPQPRTITKSPDTDPFDTVEYMIITVFFVPFAVGVVWIVWWFADWVLRMFS
jgi:hypothetical protein